MLLAENLEGLGRAQRRRSVAAQDFELALDDEWNGHRRGMPALGRAPVRNVDELARALDFAQLPIRGGEDGGRVGPRVLAVAFPRLVFMVGVARVRAPVHNVFAPPRDRRDSSR